MLAYVLYTMIAIAPVLCLSFRLEKLLGICKGIEFKFHLTKLE